MVPCLVRPFQSCQGLVNIIGSLGYSVWCSTRQVIRSNKTEGTKDFDDFDFDFNFDFDFDFDFDFGVDIEITNWINICIDTYIDIDIDIEINIDNLNTNASTVNSVHACLPLSEVSNMAITL